MNKAEIQNVNGETVCELSNVTQDGHYQNILARWREKYFDAPFRSNLIHNYGSVEAGMRSMQRSQRLHWEEGHYGDEATASYAEEYGDVPIGKLVV